MQELFRHVRDNPAELWALYACIIYYLIACLAKGPHFHALTRNNPL